MTFGERLKFLREQKGMSQEEIAKELTISRQTISKWELDRSEPTIEQLRRLSFIFDKKSIDELINGEKSYKSTKWHRFKGKFKKKFPPVNIDESIKNKGNIKSSHLGNQLVLEMTDVKEAFKEGIRLDTVMLIDNNYYLTNSNGVGRQQCLLTFEETRLSLKQIDGRKISWKNH